MAWKLPINRLCSNIDETVNQTLYTINPLGDFLVVVNTEAAATISFTIPASAPTALAPNTTTDYSLYYTVLIGDNCTLVSLKFNIILADFYFLNLELDSNYTNLLLGFNYCVAPVGDITTYPGHRVASSTFSITSASSTPLSWEDPATSNRTDQIIISITNRTRTDYWDYI